MKFTVIGAGAMGSTLGAVLSLGGGEVWFDDVLIRKDGMFVPEELHCLNPENLK